MQSKKRPELPKQQQSKKSAVAIAHPAFSVYNLRGCNIEAFITDPEGREIAPGNVQVMIMSIK